MPRARTPKRTFWQKLGLAGVAMGILAAIVASLAVNQFDKVRVLAPPGSPSTATPTVQPTPNPSSTHVIPSAPEGPTPSSQYPAELPRRQLTVPSETPIDPAGNMVWMLPSKVDLSPAQMDYVDYLEKTGRFNALYDYFYELGGYIAAADTSFTVKNTSSYPIWIDGIYAAGEVCQAPLTGTLVDYPNAAADRTGPQLGVDLDSPSEGTELAPGPGMARWKRGYFSDPVFIAPHKTHVFDIRAETQNQACTFHYDVSFFSNGRTFVHRLGSQPFRVTAYPSDYVPGDYDGSNGSPGYEAIYVGGWASPKRMGPLAQVYPET